MRITDKERAELIVELIDKKNWSFQKVADKLGLKAKSGIHEIYQREKNGVRRIKKKVIHRGRLHVRV